MRVDVYCAYIHTITTQEAQWDVYLHYLGAARDLKTALDDWPGPHQEAMIRRSFQAALGRALELRGDLLVRFERKWDSA